MYDLTHLIHEKMPVYPGDHPPSIIQSAELSGAGYNESRISFDTHTGTHADAPAHMLLHGRKLDSYPLSHFTGKAFVLKPGKLHSRIEKDFLLSYEKFVQEADFLLFNTGWSMFWGSEAYFHGYPVLSEEAAKWLASFSLKGIGFDTPSPDLPESETWPVHKIFFEKEIIIIENLIFPPECKSSTGIFHCFPLKFADADGSPVRAVLLD